MSGEFGLHAQDYAHGLLDLRSVVGSKFVPGDNRGVYVQVCNALINRPSFSLMFVMRYPLSLLHFAYSNKGYFNKKEHLFTTERKRSTTRERNFPHCAWMVFVNA